MSSENCYFPPNEVMRPNNIVEVRHRNVVQRFCGSTCTAVLGAIVFLLSFPVLFTNESWAVTAAKELSFISEHTHSLVPHSVDSSSNLIGKIVYLNCDAIPTESALRDAPHPKLHMRVPNALKLHRHVEMYQWVEHRHSRSKKDVVGGGETTVTEYTYSQEWRSRHENSDHFKDSRYRRNPRFPFNDDTFVSAAQMCGYVVSKEVVGKLPADTEVRDEQTGLLYQYSSKHQSSSAPRSVTFV
eukprot:PhM_4_TR9105/c0_g1_i1/m.88344